MKVAVSRHGRSPARRATQTRNSAPAAVQNASRSPSWLTVLRAPSRHEMEARPSDNPANPADRFYLNSLVFQVWLGQLQRYCLNQYAERTRTEERPMQTGHAWRTFSEIFEPLSAIDWVRLFENLLRFANYESYAPARTFFLAYAPLAFEHDDTGEYIGPGVQKPKGGSRNATLRVRRTVQRWCDWLEALVHFHIHELRHPGATQRDIDKAIIFLWPLLKRHNWSYADLLRMVRSLTGRRQAFPCGSEGQLADYCHSALGLLRSDSTPAARAAGPLGGRATAKRLLNFLSAIR